MRRLVKRQAVAGLLWTKQYYHIDIPLLAGRRPDSQPRTAAGAQDRAATGTGGT